MGFFSSRVPPVTCQACLYKTGIRHMSRVKGINFWAMNGTEYETITYQCDNCKKIVEIVRIGK